MEKEKLISIINDLKEVCDHCGLQVTETVLFEQGVDIYLSEYIDSNKKKIPLYLPSNDFQPEIKPTPKPQSSNVDELATDKQMKMLKKLNINYNVPLTKKEAFKLISERLDKQ